MAVNQLFQYKCMYIHVFDQIYFIDRAIDAAK